LNTTPPLKPMVPSANNAAAASHWPCDRKNSAKVAAAPSTVNVSSICLRRPPRSAMAPRNGASSAITSPAAALV
jgi:hypothetical protein